MALMKSNVVDFDGKTILASCPIYNNNNLCVNSCALFEPNTELDYTYGRCSLSCGRGQLMRAMDAEEEETFRRLKKW